MQIISSATLPEAESSRAGSSGPCPVGFFNLQGWRSHDLSGQHVPVFDHVHSMKGFCILKWNFLFLLSHTLCLLSFHWASLTEVWCCLFYFSPLPLIPYLYTLIRSFLNLLFPKLSNPSSLKLSLYDRCSESFIFVALCWIHIIISTSFLCQSPEPVLQKCLLSA